MSGRVTLRARYALATVMVFAIEVAIALKVSDPVIRPFVGDALVVVLLYGAAQTLAPRAPRRVALEVMLFAFAIECLQAVDYAAWLGADRHRWLSVLLGRTFSWGDFLAYAAGAALASLDPLARGGQPSQRGPGATSATDKSPGSANLS